MLIIMLIMLPPVTEPTKLIPSVTQPKPGKFELCALNTRNASLCVPVLPPAQRVRSEIEWVVSSSRQRWLCLRWMCTHMTTIDAYILCYCRCMSALSVRANRHLAVVAYTDVDYSYCRTGCTLSRDQSEREWTHAPQKLCRNRVTAAQKVCANLSVHPSQRSWVIVNEEEEWGGRNRMTVASEVRANAQTVYIIIMYYYYGWYIIITIITITITIVIIIIIISIIIQTY